MSAAFLFDSKRLRQYCVSCPIDHYFRRFFNEYKHFQAHCVSRRCTIYSDRHRVPHRRRRRLGLHQFPPQPLLSVVVWIPPMPVGARTSMALPLARLCTTRPLSCTGPRVGHEPSATDPARARSTHSPVSPTGLPSRHTSPSARCHPALNLGSFSRALLGPFSQALKPEQLDREKDAWKRARAMIENARLQPSSRLLGCV